MSINVLGRSATRMAIPLVVLACWISEPAGAQPHILATLDVNAQPTQIARATPGTIGYQLTSRDALLSKTGKVVVSLAGVIVSTSDLLTLMAKQSIAGTVTVSSPTTGSQALLIRFVSDTLCTKHQHTVPIKGGGTRRFTTCDPTVLAEGSRDVLFVPRLTSTRISGSRFLDLSQGSSNDGRIVRNGGMCVIHYPGCSNLFSVGHDGLDVMFGDANALPPGAEVQAFDFHAYWPQGLSAVDRGGVGSTGSYGAARATASPQPPASVHWENACQGTWGGLPIVYEVSFVVQAPEGTDLGEIGVDPTLVHVPACTPVEIALVNPASSAAASGVQELVFLKAGAPDPNFGGPIPFTADYGIGSPGTPVSVQNAEDFAIALVVPGQQITDCLSAHTTSAIPLTAKQTTSSADAARLFGSNPKFPIQLVACSTVSLNRQQIGMVVTYIP